MDCMKSTKMVKRAVKNVQDPVETEVAAVLAVAYVGCYATKVATILSLKFVLQSSLPLYVQIRDTTHPPLSP